jgi:hypothetical protein
MPVGGAGMSRLVMLGLHVAVTASVCLAAYAAACHALRIPEAGELARRLRRRGGRADA